MKKAGLNELERENRKINNNNYTLVEFYNVISNQNLMMKIDANGLLNSHNKNHDHETIEINQKFQENKM